MKIEYIEPGKLKPYQRNAKRHPEEQVQHIANSIREFGFRQPIVVDADNVVVIGHGRLLAAKKLGLESVPVVRADDLSEAQIKELRIADNLTNESPWDFERLRRDIEGLDFSGYDFGFERLKEDVSADDLGMNEAPEDLIPGTVTYTCPRCGWVFAEGFENAD